MSTSIVILEQSMYKNLYPKNNKINGRKINKIKKHNQILKPYQSTIDFKIFKRINFQKSKHIVDIGTGIGCLNYL